MILILLEVGNALPALLPLCLRDQLCFACLHGADFPLQAAQCVRNKWDLGTENLYYFSPSCFSALGDCLVFLTCTPVRTQKFFLRRDFQGWKYVQETAQLDSTEKTTQTDISREKSP